MFNCNANLKNARENNSDLFSGFQAILTAFKYKKGRKPQTNCHKVFHVDMFAKRQ